MAAFTVDLLSRTRAELIKQRDAHAAEVMRLNATLEVIERAMASYAETPEPAMFFGDEIDMRPSKRLSIRAQAEEIVRERNGEPIHADQVLAVLQSRGVSISEKDPKATVVTALLRLARTREERGAKDGIQRLGRNVFRWTTAEDDDSIEPEQQTSLSLSAAPG